MNSTNHNKDVLIQGQGTVGRGDGQTQTSVNRDPHKLQPEQPIIQDNCGLSINTYSPNPFIVEPPSQTWNENYLVLQDPRLRALAGVAPVDRGFANSSKYVSSLHQYPCYSPYNVQHYSNGQPVPKANYPHS